METTKIALFKDKKIRKTLYQNEWWFSVVDVVEALTESVDAGNNNLYSSQNYFITLRI
ncbi:MAG: hypothetical protein ACYDIA_15565 [Candidatus Humimicrobiaceae bacterium]